MRLYLATNSEVRSQIRNIQIIINTIFSKYFKFLRDNTISLLEICFLVLRLHFLPIDIGSPAPEKQSEG